MPIVSSSYLAATDNPVIRGVVDMLEELEAQHEKIQNLEDELASERRYIDELKGENESLKYEINALVLQNTRLDDAHYAWLETAQLLVRLHQRWETGFLPDDDFLAQIVSFATDLREEVERTQRTNA